MWWQEVSTVTAGCSLQVGVIGNMERLNFSAYKIPEKKNVISERAEVIGLFLTKLNSERGKYPPLKASRVAVMLSTIKSVKDLRAFYGECLAAKNFSSYYWWRFKK